MPLTIPSLDLRYYTPVDAVRAVRPVERREEQQSISTDAEKERKSGSGSGFLARREDLAERLLAKLAPVRANLSPSDEVAIFGDERNHTASALSYDEEGLRSVTNGEAVAEDGSKVAVEILTPEQPVVLEQPIVEEKVIVLNPKTQSVAAQVYARNNDITFSSAQETLLAA